METLVTKLKGTSESTSLLAIDELIYSFNEDSPTRQISLRSTAKDCIISVTGENYIGEEGVQEITLTQYEQKTYTFNDSCREFKIKNYASITNINCNESTIDFHAISRMINLVQLQSYNSYYVGDIAEIINLKKLNTLQLKFKDKEHSIKDFNIGLLSRIPLTSLEFTNLNGSCYLYTNDVNKSCTYNGIINIIGNIENLDNALFTGLLVTTVDDMQTVFGDFTNIHLPSTTRIVNEGFSDIYGSIDNFKTNIPNLTFFKTTSTEEITGELSNLPNSLTAFLPGNAKLSYTGKLSFGKMITINNVDFGEYLDKFLNDISVLPAQDTEDFWVKLNGITVNGILTDASKDAIDVIKRKGYKVVVNGKQL